MLKVIGTTVQFESPRDAMTQDDRYRRPLNDTGHDIVSIILCVAKQDGRGRDELGCYVTERNTFLYGGKPWTNSKPVNLAFARIAQSLTMHQFAEHVEQYAAMYRFEDLLEQRAERPEEH